MVCNAKGAKSSKTFHYAHICCDAMTTDFFHRYGDLLAVAPASPVFRGSTGWAADRGGTDTLLPWPSRPRKRRLWARPLSKLRQKMSSLDTDPAAPVAKRTPAPSATTHMRIALVHDWFPAIGAASASFRVYSVSSPKLMSQPRAT